MKKTLGAIFIALTLLGSAAVADDIVTPGRPIISGPHENFIEHVRALWAELLAFF